jgi:trigger factor
MSDTYKVTDTKKDTIELEITIPSKNFKESYETISKDKAKDMDIKGFRKGQVPKDIIKQNLGDTVKFETFEKLAPLYVNTAITKEKISPIAPPMYKELPKIELGKDVIFTILLTVMPDFKLGNLKKIKIEKKDTKVTAKEVTDSLEQIKKEQKTKAKDINDTWAKEIAKSLKLEDVKNLEDLKKLIKDSLKAQKEHIASHEYQDKVLEEAVKISKIEIPQAAVDYEAGERERTFGFEMQQRGIDLKDFMKAQNLTIEKMREMWKKDAKEALEADTLLNLFAKEKKVEVTEKELEKKIEEIKKSQGGKENDMYNNPQWKEYIKNIELKQKSFRELMKMVGGEKEEHKE